MMSARTFLRRADRRKDLFEHRLPRGTDLPDGEWRPNATTPRRVRLDGSRDYGTTIELRSTSILGKWHVYRTDDTDEDTELQLTSEPLEFDEAWRHARATCDEVRSLELNEVNETDEIDADPTAPLA